MQDVVDNNAKNEKRVVFFLDGWRDIGYAFTL